MSSVPEAARRALAESRVVAVLGAHERTEKPAFYVPDYLHRHGYEILPVNPTLDTEELWDRPVRDRLADLEEAVDVVDVFRRSELLAGHVDDILAMTPLPRWVWFQLGVRDDDVAARLEGAGIAVIQDRCMLADHRALGAP